MLHDNDGIPHISQTLERSQKLVVVALMKSDRRLIQDIADSDQSGPDLRGQTDSLRFSSGQGCRCPGKRQVIQTYIAQE